MTKRPLFFRFALLALLGTAGSCTRVPDRIEPKIDYSVQSGYLLSLPSAFPPLTPEEEREDWGKEVKIATGFARELDLYRAVTGFKRALYLLPKGEENRRLQLQYEVLLCYYIGKKYDEVITVFETSGLQYAVGTFPPTQDLLTMLFDSYERTGQEQKAERVLLYMQTLRPEDADRLRLSAALREGDIPLLQELSTRSDLPSLSPLLSCYEQSKKSISKAQAFNALLPGAGYLYLGQKQSAMTAFLLNGLFIGTSYYFFHKGNIPAGILFTGFEAGWYFGGIYGAGEEAKFYNERMYERCAAPFMNREKLFPVLSLRYAF